MVLQPTNLGRTEQQFAEFPRMFPVDVDTRKVAAIAGDPVLAVALPMQLNVGTTFLEPWTDASEIHSFIARIEHKASAAGETLACVMIKGDIKAQDVPLPAGQTQGALDTALKSELLQDRGLLVDGIARP